MFYFLLSLIYAVHKYILAKIQQHFSSSALFPFFFCFFEDKKSFKKKVTKRKLFSFAKLNKIYCLFFFCCQLKLFQLISFLYIAEYIASAINLTVVHGYNLSSYLVPTSVFSDPSSLFVSDFLYNCNHLEGSV